MKTHIYVEIQVQGEKLQCQYFLLFSFDNNTKNKNIYNNTSLIKRIKKIRTK